MSRKFLSGNEAFAEGIRLARPEVISAYPITPQTIVVERLSEMVEAIRKVTDCGGVRFLDKQIAGFCHDHPDTRLVVIDTFQLIRSQEKEASYATDYAEIRRVKGLADRLGICILLVHHLRKMGDSDPLNKISGSTGISGISSDNREITAAAEKGDKRALLASEMLAYQIQRYIGAYTAAMNGVDAVLFTGGIGENSWEVRERVCENMEYFGIKIDKELNKQSRGKLVKLSLPESKTEVWVVPTNEELLIARDTLALISK